MTTTGFLGFLSVLIGVLSLFPGQTQAAPPHDSSAQCQSLQSTDFSGIPDALTQVIEAKSVAASDNRVEYCEVRGYVAPSVKFQLRFPPEHWNGKLLELGCGGACGSTEHISGCDDPLRRGYACAVSDGGHPSSGIDGEWLYNRPQAGIEFWVTASHLTALASKAIVTRYYKEQPKKAYFMGCSAGGIQAMNEAERFPWDFDGIVAGGPALSLTGVWMNMVWVNRALTGKNSEPILGQPEIKRLHQAVLDKCDMNDGVRDGVIGDPRNCHFDPAALLCSAARPKECLTGPQVEAAQKIYAGPRTSTGEQIVVPSPLRGSELTWLDFFGGSEMAPTPFYHYVGEYFRYYFFQPNPGPSWKPGDLNFDRDFKRFGIAELTEPAISPDLRRFKAAGGKLLSYTGWNDPVEGVLRTVDYYETAEKIMGGRSATQDFFRLFVIPGMDHCSGGDGPFAVDYLSSLEAWVERGKAPEKLVGFHVKLEDLKFDNPQDLQEMARRQEFPLDPATVVFSRPVYPYPIRTKYLGRGDPNDAASFGPVAR